MLISNSLRSNENNIFRYMWKNEKFSVISWSHISMYDSSTINTQQSTIHFKAVKSPNTLLLVGSSIFNFCISFCGCFLRCFFLLLFFSFILFFFNQETKTHGISHGRTRLRAFFTGCMLLLRSLWSHQFVQQVLYLCIS